MEAWESDKIDRPPEIEGEAGRAWVLDLEAVAARAGVPFTQESGVAAWLLEVPRAHPVWHSYWLSLVHLRPPPEAKDELVIHLPGATHEFVLMALAPEKPRQPALDTGSVFALAPPNFAAQFIAETDGAAIVRLTDAVTRICDGLLSPDTDFRKRWIALFNDSMIPKPRWDHSLGDNSPRH